MMACYLSINSILITDVSQLYRKTIHNVQHYAVSVAEIVSVMGKHAGMGGRMDAVLWFTGA